MLPLLYGITALGLPWLSLCVFVGVIGEEMLRRLVQGLVRRGFLSLVGYVVEASVQQIFSRRVVTFDSDR